MSFGRVEVFASAERRRRWSRAEKERWVVALMQPGARSADIAREAGVDRALLYRWRKELSDLATASSGAPAFVPVTVAAATSLAVPESDPVRSPAAITIEFGSGLRMKIEGAPDRVTLEQVIGALSGAGRRR